MIVCCWQQILVVLHVGQKVTKPCQLICKTISTSYEAPIVPYEEALDRDVPGGANVNKIGAL